MGDVASCAKLPHIALRRLPLCGRGKGEEPPYPRLARYQSTVAFSPFSKEVSAEKPKNSFARDTSSFLRGCPFGFDVSHTKSPVKPVCRAMVSTRSLMLISKALPRLTGSLPLYRSAAKTMAS